MRELFFERRQQQTRLGDRRLLHHHIGERDLSQCVLAPQDLQQLRLQCDQPARSRDLPAQRRLLNGGERNIGCKGEVCAFALEGLILGERFQGLCLAPAAISTSIGAQVQQPLAWVVVVGMLLSPICSLLMIPALGPANGAE